MTAPGPQPPRKREDWDVTGFPNRRTAVHGPPQILNLPRGRGALRGGAGNTRGMSRGGFGRGGGGGGGGALRGASTYRPAYGQHEETQSNGPPRQWGSHPPPSGPSYFRQSSRYSPSDPFPDQPFTDQPFTDKSPERPQLENPPASRPISHPSASSAPPTPSFAPPPATTSSVSDTSPQAPVKPGATAKKLKFKPAKACGSKTKVLRIKQELDVKPDLHELEEELANEAAWEDPDRQDGVYFLRKEEIPPSCWGKKKKQRDDARALLAQHCAYSLRTRRRKVVDTKWRDDGVGYSWEKMAARDVEDPARVALDAEPSVAPQRATPVPVQDPSNAHGVANEVVSLKDELVTTVPWPAELATNDMRSRNNDDLDRWKLENLKQAARLDQSGRSTRSVKFRGGKLGLIIISKPLREGAMSDTLDGRKRWIATLSRSSSSTAKEPSNPSRSPHKSAHRSQPPYSLPADSSSAYVPVSIEAPPQKRQRVDPQVQEDAAPPALAPDAESATLRSLRAQIQQKLIDIDRWTNLLKDYPDFPVKKQVERTQGEVFELQAAIDTERARPGSGA